MNDFRGNLPHYCSFYARGKCNRGDECPYRHEIPKFELNKKPNYLERFHGENDP